MQQYLELQLIALGNHRGLKIECFTKTRSVNVILAVILGVISICWPRGVYKFYSCIYNI